MFWILISISVFFLTGVAVAVEKRAGAGWIGGLGVCALLVFFISWWTPQGELYWLQFTASTGGNWLVVDNSGGKTMRHWILEDSYVNSSTQSDGWQFYDSEGNGPIYVSGDSFLMRIGVGMDEFLRGYKGKYGIPSDQEALR